MAYSWNCPEQFGCGTGFGQTGVGAFDQLSARLFDPVAAHRQELFFEDRSTAISNRQQDIEERRVKSTIASAPGAAFRSEANQPALEIGGFSFSWVTLLIVALVLFFIFPLFT